MDGAALVAKVFDAFDRSADGYLDRDELFEFFSKVVAPGALLKQLKVETIEAAAEALLKRVDADADGHIRSRCAPPSRFRPLARRSRSPPFRRSALAHANPARPPSRLARRARAASKSSKTTSRFFPCTTSCSCPTSWG